MDKNLPNKITLIRTILIPLFIFFLLFEIPGNISILYGKNISYNVFLATLIFILASITDFFDGYLARKYNLVSNMGKFLDPLADKLLVGSAFIVMIELDLISSWMVVCVIAREFAVTGLRMLAIEQGEVIAAGFLGKLKTVAQIIAIILILLGNPLFNFYNFPFDQILLWISIILTILSGIEYFKNATHIIKK
ncbi:MULTISPECIES: CDP-diacylglycerol--glycerol-3-phosphate 3-phosphatidyltransferase [unclassified Gemella]|uniref:CDP-diacylglycerol--glycerol-3-phosphate 3-phosphatidyltransferase n=1 Tax=unclassified Gemella TaxID=2624949 RepID=UPI001073C86A|nr:MULTISPECIES: CDP-diacylglycerol--glycerol-3-phosphate 3-phosphatidyltransferase [unclassified Gemella]MBF0710146.1 CDP-diacylglycerol--glycerol-3-phosphate 3-phosphatidyltransferase [Gemella sp. GL1.1]MBF0746225.1 CDP-diacylglycerol--glycerol-3-phosphate 3-phosphatidyltransferase [Gemella sp. 19428wG2_WT2a]NYS27490.1 CDP-diacylglycerol--glycerol-3-phosphate 3-phosphatidyltransferase [Gemella sp. GL1]TFU60508.1 CDP-diacylglycerol--glycerol-3-phosphate 3-phosphatidyltransferase [Gemella sp. W